MKASELKTILNQLLDDLDPDVVMGELWLPEQLIDAQLDDDMLFLTFDNAPEEGEGEEEGRGFVEHEMELIREQVLHILADENSAKTKSEAILALITLAHERTSSEFIEILSSMLEE
ncbi:hypothetical protein VOA_001983 [Vibrio sp. RC586]|uniref:hypothetical protein n=1 Tax=Vibrio sp. RC586 TaxID=675815 RepID=UPI0001BB82BF|nr:hypothetical protein [Vibrio sp. RC586]EEY98165.1 hypothetical protein VOA_001983 [Vibrio sp. RC586]